MYGFGSILRWVDFISSHWTSRGIWHEKYASVDEKYGLVNGNMGWLISMLFIHLIGLLIDCLVLSSWLHSYHKISSIGPNFDTVCHRVSLIFHFIRNWIKFPLNTPCLVSMMHCFLGEFGFLIRNVVLINSNVLLIIDIHHLKISS